MATIVAIGNPHTGMQRTERYEFHGRPGSWERIFEVRQYERHLEALKGQGCDVGCFSDENWAQGARPAWWVK